MGFIPIVLATSSVFVLQLRKRWEIEVSYDLPWIILLFLWQKARQFKIHGSIKCYTWPPINNFIVIKFCDTRRLYNYHSCPYVGCKIFQEHTSFMANIVQARPHAIICGMAIFIILCLVPTRLDRFFGQVFTRLCHYSTDISPHNGIGYIIARHRWGEGSTSVWVDENRSIHDWALMRRKSYFSLTEHHWAPTRRRRHICSSRWRPAYTWLGTDKAKFIFFINTSYLHLTWWCCCHDWVSAIQRPLSNILHEDMTTIMGSLIGGFLQTRSVDVINPLNFSYKAPRIGELRNL
jgi:hypothetical protein